MDGKAVEYYLNRLEELVIEEEKIVTYKSLSDELGIHINTAKQLLQMFLSRAKTKKLFSINATFILYGKLKDSNFNISIVNEGDLKATYPKFFKITSEHIYSIQQGEKAPTLKLLCNINKQKINCQSSQALIKCSKSIIKSKTNPTNENNILTDHEITKNKEENLILQEPDREGFTQETEANSKTVKEYTCETSTENVKCLDNHKFEANKNKRRNAKDDKNRKSKNNITTFFSSAVQKECDKLNNPLQNRNNVVSNKENKTVDDNSFKKKVELNEETKLCEKTSVTKELNKKQKEKSAIKRKRIQVLSDSEESDDDFKSNYEETEVTNEESPDFLSIAFQKEEEILSEEQPLHKKKKRKIIDKTVINDDGYMETRKEYVLVETESEKEEEDTVASIKMKKSPQKVKLSQTIDRKSPKKKQASLLTFFSKK